MVALAARARKFPPLLPVAPGAFQLSVRDVLNPHRGERRARVYRLRRSCRGAGLVILRDFAARVIHRESAGTRLQRSRRRRAAPCDRIVSSPPRGVHTAPHAVLLPDAANRTDRFFARRDYLYRTGDALYQ